MINPKCKFCGKEITDKEAGYSIKINSKNNWFCNKQEYLAWEKDREDEADFRLDMQISFEMYLNVSGNVSYGMLNAYLNSLRKKYSRDEIAWFMNCNIEKISNIMSRKDFDSEYGKIRYFITVANDKIGTFLKTTPVPQKPDDKTPVDDFYMAPTIKHRPSNIRRAMSFIEQMEDDNG